MVSLRKMKAGNHLYIQHMGVIVIVLGLLSQANAQISQGGRPYSFSSTVADSIATRTMPALHVAYQLAVMGGPRIGPTPDRIKSGKRAVPCR